MQLLSPRISRTKSAVLIAILTCLATIAALAGNPPPAAAATCGDQVVVLGAPGSGQRGQGLNGLGTEVAHAYSDFVTQIRSRGITKVRSQTVDYPAAAVSVLAQLPNGPSQYFAGLDKGLTNTLDQLRQIKSGFDASGAACSGARIVLMGLSQGAMVMHRALEALAPGGKSANPALLDRIAGALLIGDGDKMPADVNLFHTFPAATFLSQGIAQNPVFRGLSGASGRTLPAAVQPKVYDVCFTGDIVCDSGVAAFAFRNQFLWATAVASGVAVHSYLYRNTDYGAVTPLATQVANIVKAGSPTTTTPSTTSPPPSTPSEPNGHPAGDCGGRVQASPTPTVCLIVRQNVPVAADYSNAAALSKGFPVPDGTVDLPPDAYTAVAALGLRLTRTENASAATGIKIDVTGTPTAAPGIYPFDMLYTPASTGQTVRYIDYIQIVPRSTPDA